jgi:multidrug efflux pump subunit AcrB
MTLSDLSIQRPVLTWVMMLALIVAGVILLRLGSTTSRRWSSRW